MVVDRTRDGGRSFETCAGACPRPSAYDLVYRHALDLDAPASAWPSAHHGVRVGREDSGDNWLTLAEHLPPVHAVSFGDPLAAPEVPRIGTVLHVSDPALGIEGDAHD